MKTDSFFLDQDLDPILANPSVDLVNLRLTLTNPDNTWEAALWGRNMLDEAGYITAQVLGVNGGCFP